MGEFHSLCHEHGVVASRGISPALFAQLADDDSETGCYCSDEELRSIVRSHVKSATAQSTHAVAPTSGYVASPPSNGAASSRSAAIRTVFIACDSDGDGQLCESEMRIIASRAGFSGTDSQWADEFLQLLKLSAQRGWPTSSNNVPGVCPEFFEELLNDPGDDGCFFSDPEL